MRLNWWFQRPTSSLGPLLLLLYVGNLTPAAHCQQLDGGPDGGGGLFSRLWSPLRSALGQLQDSLPIGVGQLEHSNKMGENARNTFNMFARLYNKTYPPAELPKRMGLFFERRRQIAESVRAYAAGQLPFAMRENAYADWDEHELKSLTGVAPPRSPAELLPEERQALQETSPPQQVGKRRFRRSSSTQNATETEENLLEDDLLVLAGSVPASKDWRSSGCVSAPINQLKCGACYAIATMSVVETMRCLRTNTAPILSAQQIVDCATPGAGYQNFGCDGGWPTRVLKYLQDVGVAVRNACYPFQWRQSQCRLNQLRAQAPQCLVSASFAANGGRLNYKVLNNERDILFHVAETGPVVSVMRATQRFLYYGTGIFDDPSCSRRRDDVDHAIVIVGYGRDNGQDYWLIKNSWGTREWGQLGYGKFKRGSNACSIGHWGWVVTS